MLETPARVVGSRGLVFRGSSSFKRKKIMNKTINGKTYTKAKFLRTTCKNCRKDLPTEVIDREGKFCNKPCNRAFQAKQKKKYRKVKKQ